MKKGLFWLLAVVITLGSAVYQRKTGPTYPLRGKSDLGGIEVRYRLPRSADTSGDAGIAVAAPPQVKGWIDWRRFKTDDAWTRVPLVRDEGRLVGSLPAQPAAGKLEYKVHLTGGYLLTSLSGDAPVVIRFKDPVPAWLIVIHVAVMFAGLLMAAASGLAALDGKRDPRRYVVWTVPLLFVGGFVLGPIIQKLAFGAAWTGFPLGTDLTDNKTLVAFLFWIVAFVAGRKGKPARPLVVAASLVTLLIFLIPHSLLGSELDYSKVKLP